VLVSNSAVGTVVMREKGSIGGGLPGTEALKVIGESQLIVQAYDLVSIAANALDYSDLVSFGTVYLDGAASLSYVQTNCPLFVPDLPNSLPTLITEGSYRRSFTNGDLVGDTLFVTHDLSEKFVVVNVFDNGGRLLPASLAPTPTSPFTYMNDESNCTIEFGAPLGLGDIYHVVVRR
jgi:hypothetical protein